jgi:hypothetical protein
MDFAFNGQSSFTALGISTGSDTDDREGHVWVTADRVERDFLSGPAPNFSSSQSPAPRPAPARLACALYPDGSGVIIDIPDDWQPPS